MLLTDGRRVAAANVENAVYGLGVCAEVNALGSVASEGRLDQVRAIAIVGYARATPERARKTPPCGRCRQVIAEAAAVAGRDVEVFLVEAVAADGAERVLRRRISDLLPEAFAAALLGVDPSPD